MLSEISLFHHALGSIRNVTDDFIATNICIVGQKSIEMAIVRKLNSERFRTIEGFNIGDAKPHVDFDHIPEYVGVDAGRCLRRGGRLLLRMSLGAIWRYGKR